MPERDGADDDMTRERAVAGAAAAHAERGATRTVVSVLGAVAGLAGAAHGVGEIIQGPVRPVGLWFPAWPASDAFDVPASFPAITVLPNLLVAGIVTVVLGLAVWFWSGLYVGRAGAGLVLMALSVALLLAGGGLGPPVLAFLLGIGATRGGHGRPGRASRTLARTWPYFFGVALLGYVVLIPGAVLLRRVLVPPWATDVVSALALGAVILALVAARSHDSLASVADASSSSQVRAWSRRPGRWGAAPTRNAGDRE